MAVAAVLETTLHKLRVEYIDYLGNVRTTNTTIKAGFVDTDAVALVGLLDPLTHCRVCEIGMDADTWYITGGAAEDDGSHYSEVWTEANLAFRSASRCKQRAEFQVPGPIDAMFSGAERIIVNPAQTDVAALNTWLETWLYKVSGATALNDFTKFAGGERTQTALPKPTVH